MKIYKLENKFYKPPYFFQNKNLICVSLCELINIFVKLIECKFFHTLNTKILTLEIQNRCSASCLNIYLII